MTKQIRIDESLKGKNRFNRKGGRLNSLINTAQIANPFWKMYGQQSIADTHPQAEDAPGTLHHVIVRRLVKRLAQLYCYRCNGHGVLMSNIKNDKQDWKKGFDLFMVMPFEKWLLCYF